MTEENAALEQDIALEEEQQFTLSDDSVKEILENLNEKKTRRVKKLFFELGITDQADLFEKLDKEYRFQLFEMCRKQLSPEIYAEIDPDVRNALFETLNPGNIAHIISDLESDDALYLIQDLDETFQQKILRKLSATMRAAVKEGLTFPEKSAGRLMQRRVVAIPQFWTVGKALDYLRAASKHLPQDFHTIYVVDPKYHIVGDVLVSRVLSAPRSTKINTLMSENTFIVKAETSQEDVAYLFEKENLYSVPVTDADDRLIGIITVDDIIDVIQEEAEDDILKLGGVSGSTDIYKAVLETTGSRFSWLAVNLITAIMASIVIGMFEATLDQIVALAILMPIVASMGGNAGTQTLTIAVRSLATKELSAANAWRFVGKETIVGLLNGILFALLISIITWLWFDNQLLGIVIGIAMIVNMMIAGLFGITIPLILERLNIDPALASSVFLTTVTDMVGFFAFLGLASWIMV